MLHYVELGHSVFQVYYIPGVSHGKESGCNERELGSVPGSERFPGEEKGNPLQYVHSMDRGAWGPWGHRVGHD